MTSLRSVGDFKEIGWYAIYGWAKTRQMWKLEIPKPEDMSDEEWKEFCDEIIREDEERIAREQS